MKKLSIVVMTFCLLLGSAVTALAWGENTDVFDWDRADQATKIQIVTDLQNILVQKGILNQTWPAEHLVAVVDHELAKDSEQAIIIDKMCIGLDLDCPY